MKKTSSLLLAFVLILSLAVPLAGAVSYQDAPPSSALADEVQKATDYRLMNGYSAAKFGYYDSMTRTQFVTVLCRMMGWLPSGEELSTRVSMWMIPDAMNVGDLSEEYLSAIEQAVSHDVINDYEPFRPKDAITRGEMAEMLVRALGLQSAAQSLNSSSIPNSDAYSILHGQLPFTDLEEKNEGYIAVAYAIGMTKGTSATTFSPNATATRAQAAAMLVRVYERMTQETDFIHGFYAISSYSQLNLAEDMDAVSAGWSRMTWDGETALLATTSANGNEYYVPSGYQEVTDTLDCLLLNVFMDGQGLKDMLSTADGRTQAMRQIIQEVSLSYKAIGRSPYSGVTIDFEGLRSAQKADFTAFLQELKTELDRLDKSLYVCVSPVLSSGYYDNSWYDGYDYAAIGKLADKVILMAYNYDPKDMTSHVGGTYYRTAATAPIDQVYLGLKVLTSQMDSEKVVLGFSCKSTAWQIDQNGALVSGTAVYPTPETVATRLAQSDTELGWSEDYQQPYAIYTTEDGNRYFLWYQDDDSVETAMRAAKLLGVSGVSIWRLGSIPQEENWNWNSLLAS